MILLYTLPDNITNMLHSNKILYNISSFLYIKNELFTKIHIKCVRTLLNNILKFITEIKIINVLRVYNIEQILYSFAEIVNIFGLDSSALAKIRKMNNDNAEYGIHYTVFTDKTGMVTGIDMKIWTTDKLAKLNLKLIIKYGNFNLDITWAYKNKDGVYVNYNRTEDILIAREEIKSILIEYVSNQYFNIISI